MSGTDRLKNGLKHKKANASPEHLNTTNYLLSFVSVPLIYNYIKETEMY